MPQDTFDDTSTYKYINTHKYMDITHLNPKPHPPVSDD